MGAFKIKGVEDSLLGGHSVQGCDSHVALRAADCRRSPLAKGPQAAGLVMAFVLFLIAFLSLCSCQVSHFLLLSAQLLGLLLLTHWGAGKPWDQAWTTTCKRRKEMVSQLFREVHICLQSGGSHPGETLKALFSLIS